MAMVRNQCMKFLAIATVAAIVLSGCTAARLSELQSEFYVLTNQLQEEEAQNWETRLASQLKLKDQTPEAAKSDIRTALDALGSVDN